MLEIAFCFFFKTTLVFRTVRVKKLSIKVRNIFNKSVLEVGQVSKKSIDERNKTQGFRVELQVSGGEG